MRIINKKKAFRVFRMLILIGLLIISFFITKAIKDEFPSVKINYEGFSFSGCNATQDIFKNVAVTEAIHSGKSDLHYYCDKKYNDSTCGFHIYSFNDNYIREGEKILIQSTLTLTPIKPYKTTKNIEVFVGIDKDNLKKQKERINNIELIYSNNKNITIYELACYNSEELTRDPATTITSIIPTFKRPSFVESKYVLFIVFIGTFFLLEQFFSIILKWVCGKHLFID